MPRARNTGRRLIKNITEKERMKRRKRKNALSQKEVNH